MEPSWLFVEMEVPEEDDQVTLVTVQGRDNDRSTVKRIYLKEHCVFCLKKTDKRQCSSSSAAGDESGRKRPRKQNLKANLMEEIDPSLLTAVNWTWAALQRRRNGEESEEDENDGIFCVNVKLKEVTKFSSIPKMCGDCDTKVKGVDKLLKEVRREIGALWSVIKQRSSEENVEGDGWREFQESLYNSELSRQGVGETVEFLEKFRKRIGVHQVDEKADIMEDDLIPESPIISPRDNADKEESCSEPDFVSGDEDESPIPKKRVKWPDSPDLVCKEELDSESDHSEECSIHDDDNNGTILETDPLATPVSSPAPVPFNELPKDSFSFNFRDFSDKALYCTVVKRQTEKGKYAVCLVDGCSQHFDKSGWTLRIDQHLEKDHNLKTDQLPKTYHCNLCGVSGLRLQLLRKHVLEVHDDQKERPKVIPKKKITKGTDSYQRRKCDLCKIKLSAVELKEHFKSHVGDYVRTCPNPDCPFTCITQEKWEYHLKYMETCRKKAGLGDIKEFMKTQRTCSVPYCTKVIKNAQGLRGHLLRSHETPEKNFNCPISGCGMKFTFRQTLLLHFGEHDVQRQVESQRCLQCGDKKEIGIEEMEAHLKEEHGVQEVVKCKKCACIFPSWEGLVDHIYEHRYGQLFCDICEAGGRFQRHADLALHYFKEHQIGKQYQCEYCLALFWKPGTLRRHLVDRHLNQGDNVPSSRKKKKTFKCEICEQVLSSQDALRGHQIKEHGANKFSCPLCKDTFTSRLALKNHEKQHLGILQNSWSCEEPNCGKVFRSKLALKEHHKYIHLREKGEHVCEHCAKPFRSQPGLKKHIETVHLGLRNYCCDICGETFTSDSVLKHHRLIHTGERPFSCSVCDQRFRHKEVLKRHLEGHEKKGADFKPNGPMKQIRKRVQLKTKAK